MAFPANPTDGQVHNRFKYNAALGLWNLDDKVISKEYTFTMSTSPHILFTANDNIIPSGTYRFNFHTYDYSVGGGHYNETYSGEFVWFAQNTNSNVGDDIVTHRMGHAPTSGQLYFKTQRVPSNTGLQSFQVWSNLNASGPSTYNLTLKRLI